MIIAVEDVGQPEAIAAVGSLYRMFQFLGKSSKKGEESWERKMCVVRAALILAESKKYRRADEFLDLLEAVEKHKVDVKNLELLKAAMQPPDYAYDMHTIEGRRMGRGPLYWYQVSSKCENMTDEYRKWREWFEPFMIELIKRKKEKEGK